MLEFPSRVDQPTNLRAGIFVKNDEQKAQDRARRIALDQALLDHMVATKQYAESWVEVERIRDQFLIDDEDRALYGLPPSKELKHQVKRAPQKP